jgi:hypothetical protein
MAPDRPVSPACVGQLHNQQLYASSTARGHHVARIEDARYCRGITGLAIIPGAQAGSYLA